jgi:hypothetical protein
VQITVSSPTTKWQMGGVMTPTLSQASTEYVRVPVFASAAGVPVNPTSYAVSMAFTTTYAAPTAWQSAGWDITQIGGYVAQCLIGPNGVVTLAPGTYYVWLKILASIETVIEPAGEVRVV